jgi:hypothetical protein
MRSAVFRTPSYRLHKPTNQAVVTLDGRDLYLGRSGSSESRAEYDRLVAEWLTNGRRLPVANSEGGSDLTINEMLLAYLTFADSYLCQERQADQGTRGHPIRDPTPPQALRPFPR